VQGFVVSLVPLLGVEPALGVGHLVLLAGIVPVLDGSAVVLPMASGAFFVLVLLESPRPSFVVEAPALFVPDVPDVPDEPLDVWATAAEAMAIETESAVAIRVFLSISHLLVCCFTLSKAPTKKDVPKKN
jgi:hypothetical protein